jgi:hypothetical protein
MTIEAFPIRVNKRTVGHTPRPVSVTIHRLVLVALVCNVCTLVLVANLTRVLLATLQP